MRSDLVVPLKPFIGDLLHIGERIEHVRRQYLVPICSVESFDGVLVRLARLDTADLDALGLTPLGEGVAIVDAPFAKRERDPAGVSLLLSVGNAIVEEISRGSLDVAVDPLGNCWSIAVVRRLVERARTTALAEC